MNVNTVMVTTPKRFACIFHFTLITADDMIIRFIVENLLLIISKRVGEKSFNLIMLSFSRNSFFSYVVWYDCFTYYIPINSKNEYDNLKFPN